MKNISKRLISFVLIGVASASMLAQSTKMGKDFLIDVNRPFVYVKFDRIAPGIPRTPTEPNSRLWLRLKNNCRIAILVRTNGVPDDSLKDEVGLEYEVVANPAIRGMVSFSGIGSSTLKAMIAATCNTSDNCTLNL